MCLTNLARAVTTNIPIYTGLPRPFRKRLRSVDITVPSTTSNRES